MLMPGEIQSLIEFTWIDGEWLIEERVSAPRSWNDYGVMFHEYVFELLAEGDTELIYGHETICVELRRGNKRYGVIAQLGEE